METNKYFCCSLRNLTNQVQTCFSKGVFDLKTMTSDLRNSSFNTVQQQHPPDFQYMCFTYSLQKWVINI